MRLTVRLGWGLFLTLVATWQVAWGQKIPDGAGIVYGDDHAFLILAPDGWVLDNEAGARQGLHAVFYPAGSSWATSDVVMYVNTARKEAPHTTVPELIQFTLDKLLEHSPNAIMSEGETIEAAGGSFTVRTLSGDQWGNHESIAYLEEQSMFVMLVLTSRHEDLYRDSLGAFNELVRSYKFLTSNVEIKR